MAFGVRTNCTSGVPPFTTQKWNFLSIFIDIMIIHGDKISHVKQVLDPFQFFFTPFEFSWGGVPKWSGHNLLMQFLSRFSNRQ